MEADLRTLLFKCILLPEDSGKSLTSSSFRDLIKAV
jgi:hypothetical protein